MRLLLAIILGLSLAWIQQPALAVTPSPAPTCGPVPNVFSPGAVANSAQVNANFNWLVTCANNATTKANSGGGSVSASLPIIAALTGTNYNISRSPDQAFSWLWDLGGKCDGATDQSPLLAVNTSWPISCPAGSAGLFMNQSMFLFPDGRTTGDSTKIIAVNSAVNRVLARNTITVASAPPWNGTNFLGTTMFDGDQSHIALPISTFITGGNTLTQPSTTYALRPMVSAIAIAFENNSGFANSTGGRTEASSILTAPFAGASAKGDTSGNSCIGAIASTQGAGSWQSGGTNWPAIVCYNGTVTAQAANTYLNPYEMHETDNGPGGPFNVGAFGEVNNMDRNVAPGTNGADWEGYTLQVVGTQAVDGGFTMRGPIVNPIDESAVGASYTASPGQNAMDVQGGMYFYLNATNSDASAHFSRGVSLGNTYFGYNVTDAAVEVVTAGTKTAIFKAGQTGIVTCTPTSARFCTQTATVVSGSRCVAQWDTANTAATIDNLQYVSQSVSGTTLTVRMETTDSESAQLAADYRC